MLKTTFSLVKLIGIILIVLGFFDILSLVFYFMPALNRISINSIPNNVKHTVLFHVLITSIIAVSFGFSFIFSGVGVLKLKEWARKLSLWTIGLHILIVIPVAPGEIKIGPVKILLICISIVIMYLLLKKSVKEQFKKNEVGSVPDM